jgi:pimeloyl-ACP methyl ester carboxylesterase
MKEIFGICALFLLGCAPYHNHAVVPFTEAAITLVRDPLDIRLIRPANGATKPFLILFATGDGGWRRLDSEVVAQISEQGYTVAGFNASRYLKTMSIASDTTTPAKLASDFDRIIRFAKESMKLPPETPVILVGISRGAGLASIAAGQSLLRKQVAGLIAIALADVEEHVLHRRRRDFRTEWVAVETYQHLRRLTGLRFEIIQSTHDKYTTADRARELLGDDTPLHHLHSVEASNHTFRDAVPALLLQLQKSLGQLTGTRS